MSSERVKAFEREVRRRRLALNMTLEALGEAAGLGGAYVGEIEAGSRRPRGLSLDAAFRSPMDSVSSCRSCLASRGSQARVSRRASSSRR
jgi:predicted transcriptional regulator